VITEIGIGLTGFGFIFTFLGILFFFDKGLLAMGNVRRHCPSDGPPYCPSDCPPVHKSPCKTTYFCRHQA
jgi:hypothetical protein